MLLYPCTPTTQRELEKYQLVGINLNLKLGLGIPGEDSGEEQGQKQRSFCPGGVWGLPSGAWNPSSSPA